MTLFVAYKDAFGASGVFEVAFDPDIIRLGDLPNLAENAEHLSVGSTTLTLDDPDADLGNAGDAILGNHRFKFTETACPSGNRRLYTGIIGQRTYSRGDYGVTGVSRVIEVELHDLNALMSFRVIPNSDRTAIRARESVTARMAWIMSTNYMNGVVDNGAVDSNATMMPKNDYRGQRPVDVVNDCEMAAGFGWNAWVRWDEANAEPELVFMNSNTSTDYTSTLRLSNVITDLDAWTDPAAVTFAPSVDAELRRDPSDLGSGVYLPYRNGAVYRTRAATVTQYGKKDIIAPNSNVSSRDRARDAADDFLWQHHTEEDRITVTVELPPSHVNLIRAGHRIQVKFQHLPGYEAFRWCRVLSRAPGQLRETDDRYTVRLELSPQEVPCEESALPTFIQHKYVDSVEISPPNYSQTYVLDDHSVIGNLLILATSSPRDQVKAVTTAPAGWNWLVVNVETAISYNNVFWKVSEGEESVTVQYDDADGQVRAEFAEYAGLANPTVFDWQTFADDPNPGFLILPATDYPAGPTAVIAIGFTDDGPGGGDSITVGGANLTLRSSIAGGLHGSTEICLADMLADGASGTTPQDPDPDDWIFGNTGTLGENLGVVIAFQGGSCV